MTNNHFNESPEAQWRRSTMVNLLMAFYMTDTRKHKALSAIINEIRQINQYTINDSDVFSVSMFIKSSEAIESNMCLTIKPNSSEKT